MCLALLYCIEALPTPLESLTLTTSWSIMMVCRSAFQDNLPQNCTSIATIRKTTRAELRNLPFDLTAKDVRAVLDALKTEPLDTELAPSQGNPRENGVPGQDQLGEEESAEDARARRRRMFATGEGEVVMSGV